ncbi:MAG: ATP-dependent helicase [Thermotogota bacterium]|nr:ATP-dependent helicase [Thermotogota bacterium]
MGAEYRVFGPPGTGKTTYLSRQIEKAAGEYKDSVMVSSFTRAAAVELVQRKLPVSRENIGTLHAICYRALGRPQIAELHIEEFNTENKSYAISQRDTAMEDAEAVKSKTQGDEIFTQMQLRRARMIPKDLWSKTLLDFSRVWEDWKERNGYMDFTDLIEESIRSLPTAPQSPAVGFFDEVQDFTPLQLKLVRQWVSHMDFAILAGDDDQCIYSFAGASPEAFLEPELSQEYVRVLDKSWRLPRKIQEYADSWIRKVAVRYPKQYRPKDSEGFVTLFDAKWKNPEMYVREIERYIQGGKTVMILTTCSYMLDPLKKILKEAAIPFHNPYRKSRGDWNPLGSRRGTTMVERILAYLLPSFELWGEQARYWRLDDLKKWVMVLNSSGVLKRGAKTLLLDKLKDVKEEDDPTSFDFGANVEDTSFEFGGNKESQADVDEILSMLEPHALERAEASDIDWFYQNILPAKKKIAKYPIDLIKNRGPRTLIEKPRLVIGTIHSVKGGEADIVYLFPDLSQEAYRNAMTDRSSRDSIKRQMYVGMTRAREGLYICEPSGMCHVELGGVG